MSYIKTTKQVVTPTGKTKMIGKYLYLLCRTNTRKSEWIAAHNLEFQYGGICLWLVRTVEAQ